MLQWLAFDLIVAAELWALYCLIAIDNVCIALLHMMLRMCNLSTAYNDRTFVHNDQYTCSVIQLHLYIFDCYCSH